MVGTERLRRVRLLSFRKLVSKDDTLRWRSWKASPSEGLRKVKEGWRDPVTMGLSDGPLPSQGLNDAFLTNFLPPPPPPQVPSASETPTVFLVY